jgi:hypothetical protein
MNMHISSRFENDLNDALNYGIDAEKVGAIVDLNLRETSPTGVKFLLLGGLSKVRKAFESYEHIPEVKSVLDEFNYVLKNRNVISMFLRNLMNNKRLITIMNMSKDINERLEISTN